MKKFLLFLLVLLLIAAAALAGYLFLDPEDEQYPLLSFVPKDFVYLVTSDEPVKDWQRLSQSKVWQTVKSNDFFADITESADYLDSLLASNQPVVNLVSLGNLAISAHMTSAREYDFLVLVDLLGKGRKAAKAKPAISSLLEAFDYQVTTSNYINNTIYKAYDPAAKESMYLSIVGNVLLFSYTEDLVKQGIRQSGEASILSDEDFASIYEEAEPGELYSLFLNYAQLDRLVAAFSPEQPDMLAGLGDLLTFSVWDLSLGSDHARMQGFLQQNDSVPSYLTAFGRAGKGEIQAHEVLPAETAMFTSIGFDDFPTLFQELTAQMNRSTPEDARELEKRKKQLEKLLKIEVERDLFSWMTDEITTAVVPDPGGSGHSFYALLHFDDYDLAKERLDYVSERIGKTMVKFETIDYRGFPIAYLELKGFFKLFFKKLFSKIEQPHYTFVDDFVVFSNDTASLQLVIDRYLDGQVLASVEGYDEFEDEFEGSANVFSYFQTRHYFAYFTESLNPEERKAFFQSKQEMLSFPHIGFELVPSGSRYRTTLFASFEEPSGQLP